MIPRKGPMLYWVQENGAKVPFAKDTSVGLVVMYSDDASDWHAWRTLLGRSGSKVVMEDGSTLSRQWILRQPRIAP